MLLRTLKAFIPIALLFAALAVMVHHNQNYSHTCRVIPADLSVPSFAIHPSAEELIPAGNDCRLCHDGHTPWPSPEQYALSP
jgi:hypothetical protein